MYIEELYEEEKISSYSGVSHFVGLIFARVSALIRTDHSAGNSKTL